MRGLAMDFTTDKNTFNIGDQYMFGPSILVNPVYEYKSRSREVYLPESHGWYNLSTGEFLEGGQMIEAAATYERMPIFIKAGSILPVGPLMEYTNEKPADPVTLYVYTGTDASFDYYEDEGTNYNYEKGKYTIIPIVWSENDRILTIGDREGEFNGMLKERKFRVVFLSKENAVSIDATDYKFQEVTYSSQTLNVKQD